jgi:hypothetical protein
MNLVIIIMDLAATHNAVSELLNAWKSGRPWVDPLRSRVLLIISVLFLSFLYLLK